MTLCSVCVMNICLMCIVSADQTRIVAYHKRKVPALLCIVVVDIFVKNDFDVEYYSSCVLAIVVNNLR